MNAKVKIRRLVQGVAVSCLAGGMLAGGGWNCVWAQVPGASVVAAAGGGVWVAKAMPPLAPTITRFFPLAEVKRGLRGVAYTVFEGVNPEPMEVEILGVLKDALGPGQDMILARLHGIKPEYTGVVAGMSGSPVYIDGRLAGALSYRIGQFSKEPIAGITPIEYMLQVRDGGWWRRDCTYDETDGWGWAVAIAGADAGDGDSVDVRRLQPGDGGTIWR